MEFVKKLLTLLNSFTPPEIRQISIGMEKEIFSDIWLFRGFARNSDNFLCTCVHTIVWKVEGNILNYIYLLFRIYMFNRFK